MLPAKRALPQTPRLPNLTELSRHVPTQPKTWFFDNEESNFKGVNDAWIKCIKSPGLGGREYASYAELRSESSFHMQRLQNDHASMMVTGGILDWMVENKDRTITLDRTAGIELIAEPERMEDIPTGTTAVFDWDRTLTATEGFFFNTTGWESYVLGVNTSFMSRENQNITEEDVWIYMFGGSERAMALSVALNAVFDRCTAQNVFILTNNKRVALIPDPINWLLKLHPNSPHVFLEGHILTTHAPIPSFLQPSVADPYSVNTRWPKAAFLHAIHNRESSLHRPSEADPPPLDTRLDFFQFDTPPRVMR